MTWEPIIPVKHSSGRGVRACIRKVRTNEPRKCVIAIGDNVIRAMGWTVGIRLTITRGARSDRGLVRVSQSPGTGYMLHCIHKHKDGKKQHGVCLPIWQGLPDESKHMEPVSWHQPVDGVLEIRLPEWAGTPTGYSEAAE